MSRFSGVETANPIEVFQLQAEYNQDTCPDKVNLGVGAYRTDEGKPWVLPVVRSVEQSMAGDDSLNHEYLPIEGLTDFCGAAMKLCLGEENLSRASAVQAVGGTGALRLGADFLKDKLGYSVAYISKPTWGNHRSIFSQAGFRVEEYRYWDSNKRCLDFDNLIMDLKDAPENAVIVLHACAHNPTGMDPTTDQWKKIAAIMKEKKLFPFFDCPYQGFASGDLTKDAWAVRYFVKEGFEMFVGQSFSKNFGLYNERVGNLIFVLSDKESIARVKSQMLIVIRRLWSNPPNHGARVIATVLNNPALCSEWESHVRTMAKRILLMRQKLHEKLKAFETPGNWDHIVHQIGMFSFTGLNARQVDFMKKKYHIYLLKNGRVNMCSLTCQNMDYVAGAINEAVRTVTDDPKMTPNSYL